MGNYRSDEPQSVVNSFDGVPILQGPYTTEKGSWVSIKSSLPKDSIVFDNMIGTEAISEPFEFKVRVSSSDPSIDSKKILEKSIAVALKVKGQNKERYFSGVATHFQSLEGFVTDAEKKTKVCYYAITLRPTFWLSKLSKKSRIFIKKKAIDIIQAVLKEDKVKFDDKTGQLGKGIKEYCVQYNESNFDFVSRLMEEVGIFYFFEHSASGEKMILAGENSSAKKLTGEFSMVHARSDVIDVMQSVNSQDQIVAKGFEGVDYDYMKPNEMIKAKETGKGLGGDVYEYPAVYTDNSNAKKLSKKRLEEIDWPGKLIFGKSTFLEFVSGALFKLEKHINSPLNKEYLIYRVGHSLNIRPDEGRHSHQNSNDLGIIYKNTFTALPKSTPFVPLRNTEKPKIYGTQTAVVVGPSGNEISIDDEGRVLVQFNWDKDGAKDGKTSCPVRCMQSWAGGNFGAAVIPRIKMEVVISFTNGDPDQPLIIGCVYNGTNKMPEQVRKDPRIAMLKTLTSPDGGKSNIVMFDDSKDKEKITVNATKDFELSSIEEKNLFTVIQDGKETVSKIDIKDGLLQTKITKGEKKVLIDEGNYSVEMKKGSMSVKIDDGDNILKVEKGNCIFTFADGELKITVKKDITIKTEAGIVIEAKKDIKIKSDAGISLKATKDIDLEATGSINLKATKDIVLEATSSINLKATKDIVGKATMNFKIEGMNVTQKATMDFKREGLNIADKAKLNLKCEGTVGGKFVGTLSAGMEGVKAEVKGSAMAALAGALTAIG